MRSTLWVLVGPIGQHAFRQLDNCGPREMIVRAITGEAVWVNTSSACPHDHEARITRIVRLAIVTRTYPTVREPLLWGSAESEGSRVSTSNPDLHAVAAHAENVGDEPVVMVNLIKFKSADHFRRFATEGQRTSEYIRDLGAERVFGGIAGPEFCADEDWDLVLLIRYPNFAAVHRTLTEESIGSFVSALRNETIERSRFIVATELETA